jgi:hypothetical protein
VVPEDSPSANFQPQEEDFAYTKPVAPEAEAVEQAQHEVVSIADKLLETPGPETGLQSSVDQIKLSEQPGEDPSFPEEVSLESARPEAAYDTRQNQVIATEGTEDVQSPVIIALEKPADQDDALSFEPYYTIDYFASLGIRYVPEEAPSDRFSQQLKSFTDWLKVMKRLPLVASVLTEQAEAEENSMQSIADRSNEEKEVVTETMAEVLARQGKLEKAIEIYRKLSLLNPSKRAYFAARIEDLKPD